MPGGPDGPVGFGFCRRAARSLGPLITDSHRPHSLLGPRGLWHRAPLSRRPCSSFSPFLAFPGSALAPCAGWSGAPSPRSGLCLQPGPLPCSRGRLAPLCPETRTASLVNLLWGLLPAKWGPRASLVWSAAGPGLYPRPLSVRERVEGRVKKAGAAVYTADAPLSGIGFLGGRRRPSCS